MHEEARQNIRKLMADRKIAHEKDLANLAGVEQSKLNRYLNNRIQEPGLDFFLKLSIFFRVSLDEIAGLRPMHTNTLDASGAYSNDPKIAQVVHAMEHMPEERKDAVVAASVALAGIKTGGIQ